MKKRVFSLILLTVLSTFVTTLIPVASAATISNYYDVDFDQAGDTNTAWTNKAESGKTFATTYNSAGVSLLRSNDAVRDSQALKLSVPKNTDATKLFRMGQENVGIIGLDNCVTWYEASFKFEQANLGGSLIMANCPFSFNESGEFYIGGIKGNAAFPGEKVTNFTLGLNEWYHLEVAADYKDKINGSPKLYAWINGQFLTTASAGSAGYTRNWTSAASTTSATALRFVLNPNSTTDSVFWLDNFKVYTTDTQVKDANGVLCFDPTDIFDGAEITSDQLRIMDNIIFAASEQTLADVISILSIGEAGAAYFDGNTQITDATVNAIGKTIYARSNSGIGVVKYTIADMASYMIADQYYDINFDDGTWTNKAGSGFTYGYDAKVPTSLAVTQAVASETIRGNNALKLSVPASASGSLYRLANKSGKTIEGLDKYVTWYELSFKYEGAIMDISMQPSAFIYNITSDGSIYLGGKYNFLSNNGVLVNNFKCEEDEWYHLVIAVDYVDSFTNDGINIYPKFYAWMNGTYLTTQSNTDCSMIWANALSGSLNRTSMGAMRFTVIPNVTENGVLWLDNFKMYTTYTSVKDEEGNLCLDPTEFMSGTEITSDQLKIEDNAIYTPSGKTLADVISMITIGSNGAVYMDGSTQIADTTVNAIGKAIHARSIVGIGVRKYTILEGSEYDMLPSTVVWKKSDGTVVTSASEILTDDSITLSLKFINNTTAVKNSILVLAAYNGDVLADCIFKDISIPVAGGDVVSNALKVDNAADLTIKAFIWDGWQNLKPEMKFIAIS